MVRRGENNPDEDIERNASPRRAPGQAHGNRLTAGDRRELRSLTKKQFQVLRHDIKHREAEIKAEVEKELLTRYRQQDSRIQQARTQLEQAWRTFEAAQRQINEALREIEPTLTLRYNRFGVMEASDPRREQLRKALLAAIPDRIASALSALEQQEIELLRELTIDALDGERAREFLARIPSIGALVPRSRLAEIASRALADVSSQHPDDPWPDTPPF